MVAGEVVGLVADRDQNIVRMLVSVENWMLFVCTAGEYEAAKKENMDPDCIGFRREANGQHENR